MHYQNYTNHINRTSQDKAASSSQATSFTDSCLSLIQPLDNCIVNIFVLEIAYLTPNKTVARNRGFLSYGFVINRSGQFARWLYLLFVHRKQTVLSTCSNHSNESRCVLVFFFFLQLTFIALIHSCHLQH